MNRIKKEILMLYYKALIRRNHIIWFLQDTPIERMHKAIDVFDDAYWNMFWRLRR